jgi:Tripartite tricarboxylate transporter TctB family
MKIKDAKDFWSGVMFAAFGLFFMVVSQRYDLGTAARMGPAFFPTMLGGLLLLLGIVTALKALATKSTAGQVDRFHFKPLLLVLGAVVAFGLLLRPAGLLVALAALVFISSLGSDEFRLRDVLLLTIGLAVLVLIVFIYALEMTVPVLPAFLRT